LFLAHCLHSRFDHLFGHCCFSIDRRINSALALLARFMLK